MQLWPGFAFLSIARPAPTPITCIKSSTTFEALISCFDALTVPANFYTDTTYLAAQPSPQELLDFQSLVTALLYVDGNCSSVPIPPSIAGIYAVSLFPSTDSGAQFCIAAESTSEGGAYAKGWGLFAVPATRSAIQRDIHLSAPHPAFDLFTPQQAGALFHAVGARSLFISGRQRMALAEPSTCVVPTGAGTVYYKTDATHDTEEPFFAVNAAIRAYLAANGGCPNPSCAFIQFHGKSASTCPTDTMFVSAGLGRSASSLAWYTDADASRPAVRLAHSLMLAFAATGAIISLPSDNTSTCALTATSNVVGRLLNGVPSGELCTQGATAATASGAFVHVEQAVGVRQDAEGGVRGVGGGVEGGVPRAGGVGV
ncbi:hypothetical protein MKEN_00217300 [Mycena kentingensis (nom. inval.)]|nr:hypothetical protein MKEN_00217300 [Mycena kentingensis (nom. inval.)]